MLHTHYGTVTKKTLYIYTKIVADFNAIIIIIMIIIIMITIIIIIMVTFKLICSVLLKLFDYCRN